VGYCSECVLHVSQIQAISIYEGKILGRRRSISVTTEPNCIIWHRRLLRWILKMTSISISGYMEFYCRTNVFASKNGCCRKKREKHSKALRCHWYPLLYIRFSQCHKVHNILIIFSQYTPWNSEITEGRYDQVKQYLELLLQR
jgi:hypothetical protein